jgi:8-oxo-dGTP pyrophosphatase MutT (NUDIX family)
MQNNIKFKTKKIQVLIYSFVNGDIKCLCLKRAKKDGGFWHVLVGTLEKNESNKECIKREIYEELGLDNILNISPVLKKWAWKKDSENILVTDFALFINNSKLTLNEEHTAYCWLSPIKAYAKYEKKSGKEMVDLLKNYLF